MYIIVRKQVKEEIFDLKVKLCLDNTTFGHFIFVIELIAKVGRQFFCLKINTSKIQNRARCQFYVL